jgi:tetratricopeptide (TPR) repeat protein
MKELGPTLELEKLEALLANVDRRIAASTSPSAKARMYNLAGDLCFDAHQPERALAYYEQAVNTHLSADQHDNAINICKKILTLTPQTVRMGHALAWLAATRGLVGVARRRIADYTKAAERAGLSKLARRHQVGLAELGSTDELLDIIGQNVSRLGDQVSAEWLRGQLQPMNGLPAA